MNKFRLFVSTLEMFKLEKIANNFKNNNTCRLCLHGEFTLLKYVSPIFPCSSGGRQKIQRTNNGTMKAFYTDGET